MKAKNKQRLFPKHFLWGASTASHQVEGWLNNDWSVWETANSKRLARGARRRWGKLGNWEEVKREAQNPANYISGRGVEHFTRYEEDFDILEKLNLNSFRFGIEWARLEPEEGQWDEEAVEHYRKYLANLKRRGITPVLNIWHWTMPVWFAQKGGFKKHKNLKYFDRFVQKIADEFVGDLKYVITLNEPNVYASFSYLTGEWPPEVKNPLVFGRVYWNLTRAHKRAYRILKAANPRLQIGVAAQLANILPKRPHNVVDLIGTQWMRYFWNWWFLNRIDKQQDFIGFNYYFTDYYKRFRRDSPKVPVNDMGWYMEPEGLYPLLVRVWEHYKKPIFVTENGLADGQDQYRQWWLQQTIIAMERALSEGIDLRGYFYWSLLDNFEWAHGWWPNFGLVEVDRKKGMKRTIRPSAKWFAKEVAKYRQQ